MGAAFGAVLQASAPAVVTYLVAPQLYFLAGPALLGQDAAWLNITHALARVAAFEADSSTAQVVTALTAWVALPLILGVVRSLRRDVG